MRVPAQVMKLVVEWQPSHGVGGVPTGMWVAGIPVAATPLWQLAQLLVTPWWVKNAPAQVSVVWQASHSRSVTMCLGPLPCACTPLWQVEQLPRTWVWSKLTARVPAMGVWQLAHPSVGRMWLAGLARAPTGVPMPGPAPPSVRVPLEMTLAG